MGAPWPSVNADEFRSPGASRCIPATANGYIPHHLDRFIARHRHGGGRGSRKGWKGERGRESAHRDRLALPELPPSKRKPLSARAGRDKSFHYGLRYSLFTRGGRGRGRGRGGGRIIVVVGDARWLVVPFRVQQPRVSAWYLSGSFDKSHRGLSPGIPLWRD
jgi:hypothetical protein